MAQPKSRPARRSPAKSARTRDAGITIDCSLADAVRRVGGEAAGDEDEQTRLEQLVRALFAQAANGKIQAAALLLERGWGKPPPALDLNLREQLLKRAKELEIDWPTDPVLAAIFDAAGIVDAGGATPATGARPPTPKP